ncbi:DUF928 domain-containing protein [Nostoc sp. ChiQUE01b]|uniref:DUF928 domain-containing protein n=1 Tax=Nostoc sp. ChiQUE01b TaxID=3075376 RepID=UPI002AD4E148|nr:DUF928 domain-containing protein [Nostoc sp. ChiQUE01b]MDZ8264370.1 DUF928 domain-containing protein [Nostoc sp. ChiQUE01b]
MKWMKPSLYFVAFSLPLYLLSAFTAQVQAQSYHSNKTWQISQTFKPPQRGKPPASAGGSTRGSSCLTGKKLIIPLIPPDKLGLTFAQHPTFFWYIPPSKLKTAKFLLLTEDQNVFYETSFTLPNKPGIISFKLPDSAPTLTVGKTYHWYLTIVCDHQDNSENPTVEGWVERTQPGATLSQALAKANLYKLPTIYAEAGIWHEALTSLVQLRRTEPNNFKAKLDWRQFFKSVGLSAIASEPLIDCCTSTKEEHGALGTGHWIEGKLPTPNSCTDAINRVSQH